MQRSPVLFGLLLFCFCSLSSAQQRAWWASFELGDGQLQLTSDQLQGSRNASFELGFSGGHRLGQHARLGLLVNGWLLQAFNLNDPSVGESVTNIAGVVDVFPTPKIGLFLRGGAGAAIYTNNHPDGSGGSGFAWVVGGGYEIPLNKSKTIAVAPIVDYASGHFGDAQYPPTTLTGRRYSVVEIKAAVVFHFGRDH